MLSAKHRIKLSHTIFVFIANMSAILLSFLLTSAASALPAKDPGRLQDLGLRDVFQAEGMSSGSCPSGWDMGCLYFNSTKALASWDDSASMCQMATPNATLVEILTELQMDFVQNNIELLEAHESPRYWWTGATDVGMNGRWMWAPSSTPVEDFIWAPGYPKNQLPSNCMMIHYSYDAGYNQFCDYTSAYPLCQLR